MPPEHRQFANLPGYLEAYSKSVFETPKEQKREMTKLADGRYYWNDSLEKGTPELVSPGLSLPEDPKKKSEIFDNEGKLRKEYLDRSKEFVKVRDAFSTVMSTDATPAGDMSLIFAYMKMVDPGSTVREGEFATAENAGSIPNNVRQMYNKAIDGTKLTESQRGDFRNQAGNIYTSRLGPQERLMNRYRELSQTYGLTPESVVYDYGQGIEVPKPANVTPSGPVDLVFNPVTGKLEPAQ